jgi:hypothetical protein
MRPYTQNRFGKRVEVHFRWNGLSPTRSREYQLYRGSPSQKPRRIPRQRLGDKPLHLSRMRRKRLTEPTGTLIGERRRSKAHPNERMKLSKFAE